MMKKTTLGAITGALSGLTALYLFPQLEGHVSDTVMWAIVLTILFLINWLPTVFIKTIDNTAGNGAFKTSHRPFRFGFVVIMGSLGILTFYIIFTNGSINNGFFNLASGLMLIAAAVSELYKLLTEK